MGVVESRNKLVTGRAGPDDPPRAVPAQSRTEFEVVTFNIACTLKREDLTPWLAWCSWDIAMFQEVPNDWENSVSARIGEDWPALRDRVAGLEIRSIGVPPGIFPAVKLVHSSSGRVFRVVSAHLAHSGYHPDIFESDLCKCIGERRRQEHRGHGCQREVEQA